MIETFVGFCAAVLVLGVLPWCIGRFVVSWSDDNPWGEGIAILGSAVFVGFFVYAVSCLFANIIYDYLNLL